MNNYNSQEQNLFNFTVPLHVLQPDIHITQYGSTVYIGMAMGGSALEPYIRKFQFPLSISIQSVF